jgi:hypothetical protein
MSRCVVVFVTTPLICEGDREMLAEDLSPADEEPARMKAKLVREIVEVGIGRKVVVDHGPA